MKKRQLALALALLMMIFFVTACTNDDKNGSTGTNGTNGSNGTTGSSTVNPGDNQNDGITGGNGDGGAGTGVLPSDGTTGSGVVPGDGSAGTGVLPNDGTTGTTGSSVPGDGSTGTVQGRFGMNQTNTEGLSALWDRLTAESGEAFPLTQALDDTGVKSLYNINLEDLTEYDAHIAASTLRAFEYFFARVADGQMADVQAAMLTRQRSLMDSWGVTHPDQTELVKNYVLLTEGDLILFAITERQDDVVSLFHEFTK